MVMDRLSCVLMCNEYVYLKSIPAFLIEGETVIVPLHSQSARSSCILMRPKCAFVKRQCTHPHRSPLVVDIPTIWWRSGFLMFGFSLFLKCILKRSVIHLNKLDETMSYSWDQRSSEPMTFHGDYKGSIHLWDLTLECNRNQLNA